MNNYAFGAGGFKLGNRVEVMTTKQRGTLVSEVIHISGCNTYQVLLPTVLKDGKQKIANYDHLLLRKLNQDESMLNNDEPLIDEKTFSPKGTDVNPEWIYEALGSKKEYIPEIDEAIGIEKITIRPGTQVYNKIHGRTMIVNYIIREYLSKEIEYGLTYIIGDTEHSISQRAYALIPMELIVDVYPQQNDSKTGPAFEDAHIAINPKHSSEDFSRFAK